MSEPAAADGMLLNVLSVLSVVLNLVTSIDEKVNSLMSEDAQVLAVAQGIETQVSLISSGVASAQALLATLQSEVASGVVQPSTLSALEQSLADVTTAAQGVTDLTAAPAPPAQSAEPAGIPVATAEG